ncbi:BppU family phage baseplate upper protein, partial [Enterococcus faecium]|nr:BppU family phage baseplate upper protein [Enterococcus faecium]MDB7283256.1 BppU family phage baseplate upper protein [Enterococcus faecium]MDB7288340.1 BppU family phage baseplate upper protein [Enterococcus faecium]MDB7293425.1 BppU family phage baseplate upper protein [Enterococcus faecium]MDB7303416.1 BppU family phage baseplate upper protein [Enterococcus faecium]
MNRKTGEIVVPTEPVSRATKITGFTFKSYDKSAGVLQFQIKNQDGSPTDLIDATVRLFMYIYQGEEKKEFPIFDNQIITESYMQGIVKYPIPDMLLSYEGKVDANVYIDFPDGSHTDNLAFTFNIEKSIIDGDVQLNGEYYFKEFQQLLDGVKQEATDAVNAALTNVDSTIEKANQQINEFVEGATQAIDQTVDEVTEQLQATQTKIDTVSQNVTSAQNNLKAVEDKMNQTNQQIGDLGKLKKIYSNSIDFGGYDYSGNPNLMNNLSFSDFAVQAGGGAISDGGNFLKINKTSGTNLFVMAGYKNSAYYLTPVLPNTTYTITYVLRKSSNFVSQSGKRIFLRYRLNQNDVTNNLGELILDSTNVTAEFTTYTKTFTTGALINPNSYYFQVLVEEGLSGEIELSYEIKLERGSTATPYQPNLLDDPYWVGKAPLGENIADPTKKFPIKSSGAEIYTGTMTEPFVVGETYTVTLKGTKPADKNFRLFNPGIAGYGNLSPVEGVTDVWSLTVTVDKVAADPRIVGINQTPADNPGACQIDWLKIEKGDTRTQNISEYKYFGEGLKDSNNPNDYSWDIKPEYTEKGLNDSVSLTEPETILGLKNFAEGLQSSGVNVAVEYA